jgi:hypothetical protein
MTVEEFIEEYNYMCSSAEIQTEEVIRELHGDVCEMFQLNCGVIPNFELTNGGRTITLVKDVK